MASSQFWHSTVTFNDINLNTYYLAENMIWLFAASDIYAVIDKINEGNSGIDDVKYSSLYPEAQKKIRIYQDNTWKTIDVLQKEDIVEIAKSCIPEEINEFLEWIKNIYLTVPEGCILSKDSKEYEFLNLATNRFLDLYGEINNPTFMDLSPEARLYKIKDIFSVYTELLSYPPIKDHINFIEKTRPPMESVISSDFIKFIRNILVHFPFYTTWDEIHISKQLINWAIEGRSIDKFLNQYQGHEDVQYRFMETKSRTWRYPTIKFPTVYDDSIFYLKDIINEKDGVLLCAILMFNVVSSQIISTDKLI